MKHAVLVPAWNRPDLLLACLERLALAVTDDVQVVVSLDRGFREECAEVVRMFSGTFPVLYLREMERHPYPGNSYNVLSGLLECQRTEADLIHVVEDDVLVARGYFAFHEAMHRAAPDAFAVSACRNQNGSGAGAAYRHPSYQSLGVSLRSETVATLGRHAVPDYFRDMVGYCRWAFPDSAIPPGHAEQDGLINRIREARGGRTVYAARPRAYHAGFYGYNRAGTPLTEGTIAERARRILEMSSEELNRRAGPLKDHEVVDLDEELPTAPEEEALRGVHRDQI